MSKLFYDNLVSLKKLEKAIKKLSMAKDEREEIWHLVDELIQQRVVHVVLDKLDVKYHDEFTFKLKNEPHNEGILDYLAERIEIDIKDFIRNEIVTVGHDILDQISKSGKSNKSE